MPWRLFFIALVFVFLLQTAVVPFLHLESLDLLLVTALICGLLAPAPEARLAGWFAGLAQDLCTGDPPGLHAFALGLMVLALTYLRELVNEFLWWARLLVTFVVAFPAQLLVQLHLRFLQHAHVTWPQMLIASFLTALVAAALTALLLLLPSALGRHRRRQTARW